MTEQKPSAEAQYAVDKTILQCNHAPYLTPSACKQCWALALDEFAREARLKAFREASATARAAGVPHVADALLERR